MTGDVRILDAPRPLPSVPCLTYDGRRVQWDRWSSAPKVLCAKLDQSCDACRGPGPGALAHGILQPHDGETRRAATKVGTYPSGRPKFKGVDVPVHAYMQLTAFLCPRCLHLDVFDSHTNAPAEAILCDGCDTLCGVGLDQAEARANLVALGGWSGGEGVDWDLCPDCNPANTPTPPPRALAVLRAIRERAPR